MYIYMHVFLLIKMSTKIFRSGNVLYSMLMFQSFSWFIIQDLNYFYFDTFQPFQSMQMNENIIFFNWSLRLSQVEGFTG